MESSARYEQGSLVGESRTRAVRSRRGSVGSRFRTRIPESERRQARRHIEEIRAILAALHIDEERRAS